MRGAWLGVVLCVACYAVTVFGGFVYDDYPYVVDNVDLHGDVLRVPRLFTTSFPSHAPERGLYRPLTAVTYWIDRAGGTLDARRFHLTNVTLAALLVIAVYGLLRRLIDESAAALGCALFAVHPVHVEAVAWITGRSEILAALFACVALTQAIVFVQEGRVRSIVYAGAACVGGILSKENAAVVGILFVFWWICVRPAGRGRAMGAAVGVLLIATAMALALRGAALGGFAPAVTERVGDGTWVSRFALAVAATGEHLRLLVWPHPLSIERMPIAPSSLGDPAVAWGAVSIVVGGVVVAISRPATLRFLALWPFVALVPVMHLVPIGETVAERFLLLPSVGVAGWIGCVAMVRLSGNVRRMAVACVLVAGAFATIARANLWRDETALWADAATHHPLSAQAWAGWGDAFRHAGQPREAIPRYERALELAPGMTAVRQTLAAAHDATERPDRALAEARKAVELDPDDPVALNNLGARLARIHRLEEADRLYLRAIEVAPTYAPALRNAAIAALSLGRPEEAAALLDRAEAVDPELPGLDALRARLRATPNAPEDR